MPRLVAGGWHAKRAVGYPLVFYKARISKVLLTFLILFPSCYKQICLYILILKYQISKHGVT